MLYILLCTVTEEGQQKMLRDPEMFNLVTAEINMEGAQLLARYAVLGRYDYVAMVEAHTHEDVARLSIELGARARVHVETLPTIAVSQLVDNSSDDIRIVTSARPPEPTLRPDPPDYAGPV